MDENLWWDRFVERVGAEAERRGGRAHVGPAYVRLEPPEGSGAVLHLSRYDDGFCQIETGFVTKLMAEFVDFDEENGVLPLVTALMDGHGEEGAGVDGDGRWIEVSTMVDGGHGRTTSGHRDPPSNAAPAQTFTRRIPAWGSAAERPSAVPIEEPEAPAAVGRLRFLTLEQAVAEGITDEEGNFLDPPGR